MFLFERSRLFLLEEVSSAFLSRRRRHMIHKYFFFAERKQAEQLFKFFFRSFHTRETCVLRRKVISHIVII